MKDENKISPELQRFVDAQKIPSVSALLLIDNETLLGMDGFGWRMMKEVLKLRKV
ncbi:hypothetical protein [Flavobacterium psychrophilum]|uniref:hypothetical protein n=1 Tax=Flavobacterium psychrophilum TaxID=96345 RepID=UPI00141A6F7B|nr:hypothetical protein [Flavobacterium psychrophilum]